MDKNTLSQYGWVTIAIIIIVILIALATPFGSYIAGSINSTKNAFGRVIEKSMVKTGSTVRLPHEGYSDLILTDRGKSDGVIIDINKTFGGEYDGAIYGFRYKTDGAPNTQYRNSQFLEETLTASNSGSVEFVKLNNAYGTGAVVNVKNQDGSLSKKYVVIIFGDVDKNGFINVNDAGMTLRTMEGTTEITDIQRIAANIGPDADLYTISESDVKTLSDVISYPEERYNLQHTQALRHAANDTNYQ